VMACCRGCNTYCGASHEHEKLLQVPAMERMVAVEQIDIVERVNKLEAFSAMMGQELEMANKYSVTDRKTGKQIFFGFEKTGLWRRQLQLCFGDCAPWELDLLYTEGTRRDLAFKLERPWTCSCCCCRRPRMHLKDAESGRIIGTIRDPIKCCCIAMKFEAFDETGTRVATASTGCGCCQCGLCCSCPCGPCSRIHLNVTGPSGKKVGRMYRQIPGWCKWMLVPDADNYFVEFDQQMAPTTKVLLMALAIFMDFRYFNNNVLDSGRTADGYPDDMGVS